MVGGGHPFLRENLAETDLPPPINIRSYRALAATTIEKSSINKNRKSTSFPMSLMSMTYLPETGTRIWYQFLVSMSWA